MSCCVDPIPTVELVGLTETLVTATTGTFELVSTKYSNALNVRVDPDVSVTEALVYALIYFPSISAGIT